MLEKPLANNIKQSKEILSLIKKYKVKVLVNHRRRYDTEIKKFGSDYLKISAIMFPAFPLFFIANATFQGLKKAIIVMYMAIMRFVLFPIIVVSIIYFQIEENYNYIFFGLASMHWTIGIIYFFY